MLCSCFNELEKKEQNKTTARGRKEKKLRAETDEIVNRKIEKSIKQKLALQKTQSCL